MIKELQEKLDEIMEIVKTLQMESNYQKKRADILENWKRNRLRKENKDETNRKR